MQKNNTLTPLEAVNKIRDDNHGQVVLVLQGGGALGAYQGGVYQALQEAGVEPDWIIGTSIGAINAGIIAGNNPKNRVSKLQEFWRRIERSTFWGGLPMWSGVADALSTWKTLTSGIPGFFETNLRAFLGVQVQGGQRRLLLDHAFAPNTGRACRFLHHFCRPSEAYIGRSPRTYKRDALL
jgi:predicted acylesterase/phospholipase RssA